MTDTSALIEGHHLVTAYPAAWCQCNHRLRWEWREQDHAAHVVAAIQAQALRDAADLRHGTDLTPTTMSLGTDQGWWYEYLQRLDETWRSNLRARAARLTATTEEPTDG